MNTKEFILAQPDERKIDFLNHLVKDDSECGCLLVHMGREISGLSGRLVCGFTSILNLPHHQLVVFPDSESFIEVGTDELPKTYGEFKAILRERGLL